MDSRKHQKCHWTHDVHDAHLIIPVVAKQIAAAVEPFAMRFSLELNRLNDLGSRLRESATLLLSPESLDTLQLTLTFLGCLPPRFPCGRSRPTMSVHLGYTQCFPRTILQQRCRELLTTSWGFRDVTIDGNIDQSTSQELTGLRLPNDKFLAQVHFYVKQGDNATTAGLPRTALRHYSHAKCLVDYIRSSCKNDHTLTNAEKVAISAKNQYMLLYLRAHCTTARFELRHEDVIRFVNSILAYPCQSHRH